jgi:hypothetical protein
LGAGTAAGLGLALAALVGAVLWLALRGRAGRARRPEGAPLTEAQREAALIQVQAWLRSGDGRAPGEAA